MESGRARTPVWSRARNLVSMMQSPATGNQYKNWPLLPGMKKGGPEGSPFVCVQLEGLPMFAAPSEVYGIGKGTSTNQHCGNPCSGHKNLLEIYTLPASVPNPIAIAHKLFWYSPIRIEPALIFSSQSAILFIPSSIKHYPFSRHPSIRFRRVCSGLGRRLGSCLAPPLATFFASVVKEPGRACVLAAEGVSSLARSKLTKLVRMSIQILTKLVRKS